MILLTSGQSFSVVEKVREWLEANLNREVGVTFSRGLKAADGRTFIPGKVITWDSFEGSVTLETMYGRIVLSRKDLEVVTSLHHCDP